MTLAPADTATPVPLPVLFGYEDHRPFAFVRDDSVIRLTDGTLWAWLSDGRLQADRSGAAFAYQHGATFYDIETHQPLYYQRP